VIGFEPCPWCACTQMYGTMRALTLTQPFAGLVASGIKTVENRPRNMIKRTDFGTPFAIHASREIDDTYSEMVARTAPELFDAKNAYKGAPWYQATQIISAIVGVATIDCVIDPLACGLSLADPNLWSAVPEDQRRWCFGPIVYVLKDIKPLPVPIPCRGYQSFWYVPDNIEEAITKQLEGKPWEQALYPKWRCAACDHRWRPVPKKAAQCSKCTSEDVFVFETAADRMEWDQAGLETRTARHRTEMLELSYGDD
jgi:hypothetical protein